MGVAFGGGVLIGGLGGAMRASTDWMGSARSSSSSAPIVGSSSEGGEHGSFASLSRLLPSRRTAMGVAAEGEDRSLSDSIGTLIPMLGTTDANNTLSYGLNTGRPWDTSSTRCSDTMYTHDSRDTQSRPTKVLPRRQDMQRA